MYDDGHVALHRLDLSVASGEFCTLLGPSGSGKTTLLRILAGLLTSTDGRIRIDDRDVTDVAVQDREIGFVFQNYALFPHLTVAENVAFPLRVRRQSRRERERRVAEVLDLVQMSDLGRRYPAQLSGGQQQRVAIARALVFDPKVLLLDEPLGALDRRLRQQLGAELRRIQQATSTTAIYVTHDQDEAFLLSDTVVVMNHGEIRQIGHPADVYGNPADRFVATFLGETNVIEGRVLERSGDRATIDLDGVPVECTVRTDRELRDHVACSLRPEDVQLFPEGGPSVGGPDGAVVGRAVVEQSVFLGSRFRLGVRLGERRLLAEVARGTFLPDVGSTVLVGWRIGAPVAITQAEPDDDPWDEDNA